MLAHYNNQCNFLIIKWTLNNFTEKLKIYQTFVNQKGNNFSYCFLYLTFIVYFCFIQKAFLEDLILEYQVKLTQVNTKFKRYLFQSIDLNNRLIAIKGARGVGKTTLLLQIAKEKLANTKTLYISLDHIYFYENKIYELAKKFEQFGGSHL